MNGVDINLFQFEYDLTWMAFFMDAEDRFYARYGGREGKDPETFLTKLSLQSVMKDVLRLHRDKAVQTSRYEPTAETPRTPEDIPPMTKMISRRKPDQRCIHCHDVKTALLRQAQAEGNFSKEMIFTYPPPSALGFDVNPDQQNVVKSVKPNTSAEKAGIKPGDRIRSADGQRILTAADLSRVLELAREDTAVSLKLEREDNPIQTSVKLDPHWRDPADAGWRASVHLAGPGPGFWAQALDAPEKAKLDIPADGLALKVTFLFPKHPTPPRSGLKLGDIVIDVDGVHREMNTRQFHAWIHLNRRYGEKVPIVVLRNSERTNLSLELPKAGEVADD